MQNEIITTEKMAEILDLSEWTIQKKAREGLLKGKKFGKRWYFTQKTLDDLMSSEAAGV